MIVDLVSSVQREDWVKARQILYQQWLTECPRVYQCNQHKPWEAPSEEQSSRINETLFVPLVKAISCPADPEANVGHTLAGLTEQIGIGGMSRAGQICGHVFKNGELTYSCSVCATDPTCVMCHECFHKSEHKNHKYKVQIHSSNGSGYCDCGDPDAWKSGYACPDHLPREEGEGEEPPRIPEDLRRRLKALFTIILQYCTGMVCHEAPEEIQKEKKPVFKIPEFIKSAAGDRDEITGAGQYLMALYNDETHTFDTVIRALEIYVGVSTQDAMLIATIVDREGRCLVRYGTKNECDDNKKAMVKKVNRDVNRRTDKNDPLSIHVFENEIVVNQCHAVALMVWLNHQLEIFPPLAEIVGEILLGEQAVPVESNDLEDMEIDGEQKESETILVKFLRYDKKLWKIVRQNVHQLLMKTVLMKYDQKMELAKTYFRHYDDVYNDFIDDDHDLEMSIVSLAVQFLTVPSLARRLIAEDNVMDLVWTSILEHTVKYCKTDAAGNKKEPLLFDFSTRQFPVVLKRALHMVRDLGYILNIPPTESQWTDELRDGFVRGVARQLEFISRMQGMDEVKRQAQEHQVWEMEWESAFNIQIRIQEVLTLTQLWAYSDKKVHRRLMAMGLDNMMKYRPTCGKDEGTSTITHMKVEINDELYVCPQFDILQGVVSIHQPLWRFTAGLFAAGRDFLDFFNNSQRTQEESQIVDKIKSWGTHMFEEPLRVQVLCAQVQAQLWRRNGFSLINQIHNYYSPICRVEMYDRDLLMMQVAAVLNSPRDLLMHIITRYRLAPWSGLNFTNSDASRTSPYGSNMDKDETSKIIVTLAEEMLHLLINMISERYQPGVGKSSTSMMFRRELVHLLCTGPHPFSQMSDKMGRFQLMRKMANDPSFEKIQLHDIVNDIAECKKLTPTSAGQFHLKDACLREYNPFFYHYSKGNISAAELYQQKIRQKMDRSIVACPPPVPCEFEPFFQPVVKLLNCPVMIRLCRAVLERTHKRSRYSSDRLLHRSLYLIGMGLQEQEQHPTEFDYLGPAAQEGILKLMEDLNGTAETGTHADLLWWTIQKYKEVERRVSAGPDAAPMEETVNKEDSPSAAKARRAEMAAKMRAQAMKKMQTMQNKFIKTMEPEAVPMEVDKPIDTEEPRKSRPLRIDDDDDWASVESDDGFPVCLGIGRWKIDTTLPRKVTCMLCQEEELLEPGRGTFVCAAYVQRSMLFAQKQEAIEATRGLRHDFVSAALPMGLDTSTCSHVMHYECYQSLMENTLTKERNRPRQHMPYHKMIDIELGEYHCPLCKRLSNTALPVLPAVPLMNIKGFSSARLNVVEDFDSWVARVKELLEAPPLLTPSKPKTHSRKRSHSERSLADLAKQGDDLSSMPLDNNLSTSVPSASTMQLLMGEGPSTAGSQPAIDIENNPYGDPILQELTAMIADEGNPQQPKSPTTQRPEVLQEFARHIQKVPASVATALRAIMQRTKNMSGPTYDNYSEAIRIFAKFLVKTQTRENQNHGDSMKGYLATITTWQSTVHVIRSISAILQAEGKPLFGALNTRQRDCCSALTRLSASLSYYMQNMPLHIQVMLRALLSSPPSVTTNFCPTSPKSPLCVPVASVSNAVTIGAESPATPPPTPHALSFKESFTMLFLSTHQKLASKGALVNILHIDMLNLAVSLAMSIGWTWSDGKQSMKQSRNQREMLPDGSLDELHCIRLCLCGILFQVMATVDDGEMTEEDQIDDAVDARLCELWAAARPEDAPLVEKKRLRETLREAILSFLRPLALFYNNLTMVPPPEALRDPSVDEFEPLCRYMGLPSTIGAIIDGPAILSLFQMWSAALPPDPWQRHSLVKQPVRANQLIDLPEDFSDLIQMATTFRCPTVPFDEPASNTPTICLVCGTILCSQSYCCQKTVGKETMGACRFHMLTCSGSVGLFLRIRDCIVVLMTTRRRGCIRAAPYVDEFGESDQGFRRGNPLHLNHALYNKLKQLWMSQGIAEEVVNQFDIDHRNIQFDFIHL